MDRTILNAQMPGVWKEDASASGAKRFVPDPCSVDVGLQTSWMAWQ